MSCEENMSSEEFAFFTPEQLVELRNRAIITNKEKIKSDFAELFSRMCVNVKCEINSKLAAAAELTWEQSDAKHCCLKFTPSELICVRLTDEERDVITRYYSYNNHLNLDERLYNNGVSTMSTKLMHLNYFLCDIIIPIVKKLAEIGYIIEWDLYPNDWTFSVNWKLT